MKKASVIYEEKRILTAKFYHPQSDPYMQKNDEHWHKITGIYMAFEDKKPIIEFEPNRIRIISYPAEEHKNNLFPGLSWHFQATQARH